MRRENLMGKSYENEKSQLTHKLWIHRNIIVYDDDDVNDRNNSNKIEWNRVNYQMVKMKNNKIRRESNISSGI